jgi:hypothetical protein
MVTARVASLQMLHTVRLFVALAAAPGLLLAQATLQITAPKPGTIVNPGQTFVVEVSASGGPFTNVSAIAPAYASSSQTLSSPPYQFSFTIPAKRALPERPVEAAMLRTTRLSVALAVASGLLLAQATLRITTPIAGTVVRPGERFVIYVTPSGGSFTRVAISGPDLLGGGVVLTSLVLRRSQRWAIRPQGLLFFRTPSPLTSSGPTLQRVFPSTIHS